MKNLKFTTAKGINIELDENDMMKIHQHYEVQCTADYLKSLYPKWTNKKIQAIAEETRRQMDKYGYDEEEAIEIAIENY